MANAGPKDPLPRPVGQFGHTKSNHAAGTRSDEDQHRSITRKNLSSTIEDIHDGDTQDNAEQDCQYRPESPVGNKHARGRCRCQNKGIDGTSEQRREELSDEISLHVPDFRPIHGSWREERDVSLWRPKIWNGMMTG
jgi:hypothetical protein